MADTPKPESSTPDPPLRRKRGRGVLWAIVAVVIAFAAGFLWQYYEATTIRAQLATVEQDLAMERLRVRMGQATLAAQAGEFETARQQMSDLFQTMQQEGPTLPPEIGAVASDFLDRRDDVITGLSRSNPAYADVLYGMLQRLGTVIDRLEGRTVPSAQPGTGEATPPGPTAPEPESVAPAVSPDTL